VPEGHFRLFRDVSILVLLDSWAKTSGKKVRSSLGFLFQSLFCWIHGLRLLVYLVLPVLYAVSILVLLDSWAKTWIQESDISQGMVMFQSLFCWIHGLRPAIRGTPYGVRGCFNPCFVGFMG